MNFINKQRWGSKLATAAGAVGAFGKRIWNGIKTGASNAYDWITEGEGGQAISKLWNDFTGQSAIDKQLAGEKDLMNYQNELNRQNLIDSASLQKEGLLKAGLNTALAYGGSVGGNSVGSVANHGAPLPMSGSEKLDKLLGSIQGVQGLMNNQYQLAANTEALKQKVIETQSDKVKLSNLLRHYYEEQATSPFGVSVQVGDQGLNFFKLPKFNYQGRVYYDRLSRYQDSVFDQLTAKSIAAREGSIEKGMNNWFRYGISSEMGRSPYGRGHNWLQKDYLNLQYDLLNQFGKWDKYANYISKGIGALGDLAGGFFKGIGKLKPPKTYTIHRR